MSVSVVQWRVIAYVLNDMTEEGDSVPAREIYTHPIMQKWFAQSNAEVMERIIPLVRTIMICPASRAIDINGLRVELGQPVGFLDGEISSTAENPVELLCLMIEMLRENPQQFLKNYGWRMRYGNIPKKFRTNLGTSTDESKKGVRANWLVNFCGNKLSEAEAEQLIIQLEKVSRSRHHSGRAIDIRWPGQPAGTKPPKAIRDKIIADLERAIPGIKALPEGNHLHIAFPEGYRKTLDDLLEMPDVSTPQLQTQASLAERMSRGQGTALVDGFNTLPQPNMSGGLRYFPGPTQIVNAPTTTTNLSLANKNTTNENGHKSPNTTVVWT